MAPTMLRQELRKQPISLLVRSVSSAYRLRSSYRRHNCSSVKNEDSFIFLQSVVNSMYVTPHIHTLDNNSTGFLSLCLAGVHIYLTDICKVRGAFKQGQKVP